MQNTDTIQANIVMLRDLLFTSILFDFIFFLQQALVQTETGYSLEKLLVFLTDGIMC